MNEIGRNLFEETGDSEGDRSEVIESETHFIATDRRPTAALVKCVAASFQRAASRPRSRSGIDSRLPPELFKTASTVFAILKTRNKTKQNYINIYSDISTNKNVTDLHYNNYIKYMLANKTCSIWIIE